MPRAIAPLVTITISSPPRAPPATAAQTLAAARARSSPSSVGDDRRAELDHRASHCQPEVRRARDGALGLPAAGIGDNGDRGAPMKIDAGGYWPSVDRAGAAAAAAEAGGYDGWWASRRTIDPFLGCAVAAERTERLELGTGIAVAFARNPMSVAVRPTTCRRCQVDVPAGHWGRRSSRTSPGASRCRGRNRRRGCASSFSPSGRSGQLGEPGRRSPSAVSSTRTR